MSEVTIYHNPQCSTSRKTLGLLEARGVAPKVVEYLQAPPTEAELARVIKLLGVSAHDLVRTKESDYAESGLTPDSPDADIIAALVRYPKLLERPIVTANGKAALGRPPESVLDIL